ncbi:MAG: hypothetical protein IKU54_02530 [Oscillospiraceae bacterium]|nr:hypothetical protein [Oscillospiraceae bacterium]
MRVIKVLLSLMICAFIFTGCIQEKEEIPEYHLNIIAESFQSAYDYYKPSEREDVKYLLQSADTYSEFLTEETAEYILSVTVCDANISTETAQSIADICKTENIPVFFLMNDIDKSVLDSYDKCYCISADYAYIGEQFARKINELWENEIIDKNGDRIFTFSVVKPEILSNIYQNFYDAFLLNIELLGIPLQQLDEIFLTKGDVLDYCNSNKTKNETFIILESDYLNLFPENYQPHREGVEIIGMNFNAIDNYRAYPYMRLCFIDYTKYFDARDRIINNINNKVYPFENLEYNIIDKYIYIKPTI